MKRTKISINTDSFFNIDKRTLKKIVNQIIKTTGKIFSSIELSFVSDKELLELNKKFLNHNYYTDILTFSYTLQEPFETEIVISYDRAVENAKKYRTKFEKEILRLITHGILHTVGFEDKTKAQKIKMRKLENNILNNLKLEGFIKK